MIITPGIKIMTRKVGDVVFIEVEPDGVCAFCGKINELRPYGPNNESICFDCAMKDEETTIRKFHEFVDGPGEKPQ